MAPNSRPAAAAATTATTPFKQALMAVQMKDANATFFSPPAAPIKPMQRAYSVSSDTDLNDQRLITPRSLFADDEDMDEIALPGTPFMVPALDMQELEADEFWAVAEDVPASPFKAARPNTPTLSFARPQPRRLNFDDPVTNLLALLPAIRASPQTRPVVHTLARTQTNSARTSSSCTPPAFAPTPQGPATSGSPPPAATPQDEQLQQQQQQPQEEAQPEPAQAVSKRARVAQPAAGNADAAVAVAAASVESAASMELDVAAASDDRAGSHLSSGVSSSQRRSETWHGLRASLHTGPSDTCFQRLPAGRSLTLAPCAPLPLPLGVYTFGQAMTPLSHTRKRLFGCEC